MSVWSKWTTWSMVTLATLAPAGIPGVIAHAGATGSLGLVSPDAARGAVTSGDQLTPFVIEPPAGAACPGDTQHDGWQLVGFILPADDDPTKQVYTTLGPTDRYVGDVTRRLALYRAERAPVGLANLPRNDSAGEPGRIPSIPTLTFQQPATLGLAGGRYQLGIGCVHDTDLGDYWTAIVDISRPADLKSVELTWTVVQAAPVKESSSGSSSTALTIVVALGCLLGVGLIVRAFLRRRVAARNRPGRVGQRPVPKSSPRKDTHS